MTLNMTFNHQNGARNSLFNQNDTKKRSASYEKTFYISSYFSFSNFFFLHFDEGIDITTLKMTLNSEKNTINVISSQNLMKKRYYACF